MRQGIQLIKYENDSGFCRAEQWLDNAKISYLPVFCSTPDECAQKALDVAEDGLTALISVSTANFLKMKYSLIKECGVNVGYSNEIACAMKVLPETSNETRVQTAIPANAKVFLSSDGAYSAFAFKVGKGLVIAVPADIDRFEYALNYGLDSLIRSAVGQKYTLPEIKHYLSEFAKSGKTVTLSSVGASKAIIALIKASHLGFNSFSIDPTEESLPEETENYIAYCAKNSKEVNETDYGVAISSINEVDGDRSVTVSVATSNAAKVAVVHSLEGESDNALIAAAIIKLCQMLSSAAGIEPEAFLPEKLKIKKSKYILISAVAVLSAISLCTAIAVFARARAHSKEESLTFTQALTKTTQPLTKQHTTLPTENELLTVSFEEESTIDLFETTRQIITTIRQTTTALSTTALPTTTSATSTTEALTKHITTTSAPETTTKAVTTVASTTAVITTVATTAARTIHSYTTQASTEKMTEATSKASSGEVNTNGKFVFTVHGYGHGVGMSQEGAKTLANQGFTYDKILERYFPGTKLITTDSSLPSTVTFEGKSYGLLEYLCRVVDAEIGTGAPTEALKAQAVCAYTYAKTYKFAVSSGKHAFRSIGSKTFEQYYGNKNIVSAVESILGNYLTYNGSVAHTFYFASSAGKTTSSASVWGGDYAYLRGGVESPETVSKTTVTITAADMKTLIEAYAKKNNIKIKLSDDPSQWIEIISHDKAVNDQMGYVSKVRFGDCEKNGNTFRNAVLNGKIRSHCFTVEYI